MFQEITLGLLQEMVIIRRAFREFLNKASFNGNIKYSWAVVFCGVEVTRLTNINIFYSTLQIIYKFW